MECQQPEIISISPDNKLVFHQNEFIQYLHELGFEGKDPVIVVSVVGDPKSGKSFLINLIAKYLRANGQGSWVGEDDSKLGGFDWNPNLAEPMEKDGTGIRTLKDPLIISTKIIEDGLEKEIRATVILLDIDLNEGQDGFKDNYEKLVAFSTLVSSVTIWVGNGTDPSDKSEQFNHETTFGLVQRVINYDKSFASHFRRDIIFLHNEYSIKPMLSPAEPPKFPEPITDEHLGTAVVKMQNLMIKNRVGGYFQGEPKFLNKQQLLRMMGKFVTIDNLLNGWKRNGNGLTIGGMFGKYGLMDRAIIILNQTWSTAALVVEKGTASITPTYKTHNYSFDKTTITSQSKHGVSSSASTFTCTKPGGVGFDKTRSESPQGGEPMEVDDDMDVSVAASSLCTSRSPNLDRPTPTASKHYHGQEEKSSNVSADDIFKEFNKLLKDNFRFFVLSSHARSQLVQMLHGYIESKYSRHPKIMVALKKKINDIVAKWIPLTSTLDISLMKIDNEFDSRTDFRNELELLNLVKLTKDMSAKRFRSNGNQELERMFDHSWKIITKTMKQRNERVQQHELQLQDKMVQMVLDFFKKELDLIIHQKGDVGKLANELQQDCVKMFGEMYDFKHNQDKANQELKDKMDKIINIKLPQSQRKPEVATSDPLHSPQPSPSTTHAINLSYAAAASHQSNGITATRQDYAYELRSRVITRPGPTSTVETSQSYPSSSSSSNNSASAHKLENNGAILVIRFARTDKTSCTVVQKNKASTRFESNQTTSGPFSLYYADEEFKIALGNEQVRGNPSFELQKLQPGNSHQLKKTNDQGMKMEYEEIVGLFLAKVREYYETKINELVVNCIVVVPIMNTTIRRKAIYDSAKCAGFHLINIITEPTAAAFNYYNNPELCKVDRFSVSTDEHILMIYMTATHRTEFVILSVSQEHPNVRVVSVSGSQYFKMLGELKDWTGLFGKSEDQKYFKDVLEQAKLKATQLRRIFPLGDTGHSDRALKGSEFDVVSRKVLNFTEAVFMGATSLAVSSARQRCTVDHIVKECLPYEINLSLSYQKHKQIFSRSTPIPANVRIMLDIGKSDHEICFDIVKLIGTLVTVLGNYTVQFDSGSSVWNAVELTFDLDSNGIITVKGSLTDKNSNGTKRREVIVSRSDRFNKKPEELSKIQRNIEEWMQLSKDKALKVKLYQMFKEYVDCVKPNFDRLVKSGDSSKKLMAELMIKGVNNVGDMLKNENNKRNFRADLSEQLKLIEQVEGQLGVNPGTNLIQLMQDMLTNH